MDIIEITFFIFAALVVLCIYKALTVEKVMQSAYWLIIMLINVAFIFLLAISEILFVFQISIYSGGIAVLLLFTGVLTEMEEMGFKKSLVQAATGVWMQLLLFVAFVGNMLALILFSLNSEEYTWDGILGDSAWTYADSFAQVIGFSRYMWGDINEILVLVGFLILVALLGSVKLAIREDEIEDLSEEVILRLKGETKEVSS